MFCDPSYFQRDNPFPLNKGEFASIRRCLYGKESSEYLFEYTSDFWKKYKDNRKFARLLLIDGHDITGEVIKYLDLYLYNFLTNFMEKRYLDDIAVIIGSDHGLHYGIFFIANWEDLKIEKFLPFLFLLLPNNNNTKINKEQLLLNQDKFITAYDIYNTMLFIVTGEKNSNKYSDLGASLFNYINPSGRNCNMLPKSIRKNHCYCKQKIKDIFNNKWNKICVSSFKYNFNNAIYLKKKNEIQKNIYWSIY